jgi:hypothetical protein
VSPPAHLPPERCGGVGHLQLPAVERAEAIQRLVRREQIVRARGSRDVVAERDHQHLTAALLGRASPGGVDEHLAHRPRRDGEEVRALLPPRAARRPQLHVRLVDEGRGGERGARAARAHPMREPVELPVGADVEVVDRCRRAAGLIEWPGDAVGLVVRRRGPVVNRRTHGALRRCGYDAVRATRAACGGFDGGIAKVCEGARC